MSSIRAIAIDSTHIEVHLPYDTAVETAEIKLDKLDIRGFKIDGNVIILTTSRIDIRSNYLITVSGRSDRVDISGLLESYYSSKPLGCIFEQGATTFRVFAPRASRIQLLLYARYDCEESTAHDMERDEEGVWELTLAGEIAESYYTYGVTGPQPAFDFYELDQIVADPYSKAVVSKDNFWQESKSIIVKPDNFNWGNDAPVQIKPEDLIIYEAHVRDMTMHSSCPVQDKGTYRGLVDPVPGGALDYIKQLGANAIELLPCQHFAKIEPPLNAKIGDLKFAWNVYERNHWGYMTTYFFAPEPYYSTDHTDLEHGTYSRPDDGHIREFKEMVKAFHQAGVAVILDVVYNHVSNYDLNPLRHIDKHYYFRLNERFDFLSNSGCGNDFKSERRMARRLIVDSVKYWLEEFHIDGLRFDLAAMLDWETIDLIGEEARKINPDVILISEPWGGGKYDLGGFSNRGWLAWNDLYRNGVKGSDPTQTTGFIMGDYYGADNQSSIEFYASGSLRESGGPFIEPHHSVNYLESHDGYTLGDFIRIACGAQQADRPVIDMQKNTLVAGEQLRINKIAALFQMTSQGTVMIHQGQEFARSKVIAPSDAEDPKVGYLDHDSYEKDNETNWLNYDQKVINRDLYEYYRGLIWIRKEFNAFGKIKRGDIHYLPLMQAPGMGFLISKDVSGDPYDFLVLINANRHETAEFQLPDGSWKALVNPEIAAQKPFKDEVNGTLTISPSSGFILVR